MQQSPYFDFVRNMYLLGKLSKKQVQNLVPAKITKAEADEIVNANQ